MGDGLLKDIGELAGVSAPGSPVGGMIGGALRDSGMLEATTAALDVIVQGLGDDGAAHASGTTDVTVEAALDGDVATDGDVVDAYGEPDVVQAAPAESDATTTDDASAPAGE